MPYRRRIDGCSFVFVWIKTPATERPAVRQSIHVPGRVSSIKTIGVKSWSQRQMDLFNDALRQFIPRVTINHSGNHSFKLLVFFLLDIVFKNLSVLPQSIDKRVTVDMSGVIFASELFPIWGHTQEDSVCMCRHAKKKIGKQPQYQLRMEGPHAHTLKRMREARDVYKFAHNPTSPPLLRCAFHGTAATCNHMETRAILASKVASPCPAEHKPSLESRALKWN